jgi:hypothetical protein
MRMGGREDRDFDEEWPDQEHPGPDPESEPEESDDDRQAQEHDLWEEIERAHELEEQAEREGSDEHREIQNTGAGAR